MKVLVVGSNGQIGQYPIHFWNKTKNTQSVRWLGNKNKLMLIKNRALKRSLQIWKGL